MIHDKTVDLIQCFVFFLIDQQSKITDEDIDVKGVGVIKPEKVDNQSDGGQVCDSYCFSSLDPLV